MTSYQTPQASETVAETSQPCPCIKEHQRAVWDDGDYAAFATYMEAGAVEVLEGWPIRPGDRVLDVACGSGQTALPAARLGAQVTGIDIAASQIAAAQRRADEEGLNAQFEVGDVEDLRFEDGSFDVVITMFGAMFAPDPVKTAAEMSRVLRPGGRLIMANWTSTSMPARMFRFVSQFTPPHPDVVPPVLWGDEQTVVERLSETFTDVRLQRRIYPKWDYPFDASDVVDLFRDQFGPVKRAFEATDPSEQIRLHDGLEQIFAETSLRRGGVLTISEGQYLEVIATRR